MNPSRIIIIFITRITRLFDGRFGGMHCLITSYNADKVNDETIYAASDYLAEIQV